MNMPAETAHVIDDIICSDLSEALELNHAFEKAFREAKNPARGDSYLSASWFECKLGAMLAIADERAVHMLEFYDRRALLGEVKRLRAKTRAPIAPGLTAPLILLRQELEHYFSGKLKEFTTPVVQFGTPFQMAAWQALRAIPYGETRSYQEQAAVIGHPAAHRAVANANGCNQIAVVFPCHRIIKSDGSLGGYGGRINRKKWLLDLEKGLIR